MIEKGETKIYLQILKETAQELSQTLQEEEVIQILITRVVTALRTRGAVVRLLSPDGTELLPAGVMGLSETYIQKGPVRIVESQVDQKVLAGKVVVVPDVASETGFQYPAAAAREGLKGMVAVPMTIRGRVMGVLRVYVDNTDHLQPEDHLLLGALADLGALTIEKIRLHQSLYKIAEALNSSLELKTMLQQVLTATVSKMGLKAASIRLLDPKHQILRLVAACGLSEEYLSKGDVHVSDSPVDQRVLQGETVTLYDVEHEVGFEYPEEATREGIRSVLVVPIKLKDRILGVMRVYSARPRHFGLVAINFLKSVANLVAMAIENAELYATLRRQHEDLKMDLAEWYRFLALG